MLTTSSTTTSIHSNNHNAKSIGKIVESFPHLTVTPIVGQPSYKMIAEIQLRLNTNAASIYSHRDNGLLGLLFLTVKPAVYNTQSTVTFIPLTNLGQNQMIPARSTGPQIAEIRRQHKPTLTNFRPTNRLTTY